MASISATGALSSGSFNRNGKLEAWFWVWKFSQLTVCANKFLHRCIPNMFAYVRYICVILKNPFSYTDKLDYNYSSNYGICISDLIFAAPIIGFKLQLNKTIGFPSKQILNQTLYIRLNNKILKLKLKFIPILIKLTICLSHIHIFCQKPLRVLSCLRKPFSGPHVTIIEPETSLEHQQEGWVSMSNKTCYAYAMCNTQVEAPSTIIERQSVHQ